MSLTKKVKMIARHVSDASAKFALPWEEIKIKSTTPSFPTT